MEKEVADMNVKELKEALSDRGLDTTGKKQDLIERLNEALAEEEAVKLDCNIAATSLQQCCNGVQQRATALQQGAIGCKRAPRRDALLAIETAAADHLAPAEWTTSIAAALTSEILPQLEHLITEVRLILNAADQHPDLDDEHLP
jgi:hypothetical protein